MPFETTESTAKPEFKKKGVRLLICRQTSHDANPVGNNGGAHVNSCRGATEPQIPAGGTLCDAKPKDATTLKSDESLTLRANRASMRGALKEIKLRYIRTILHPGMQTLLHSL